MSPRPVQYRVEENVAAALDEARAALTLDTSSPNVAHAAAWALVALAEAVDGIRQELVAGLTSTTYSVEP